MLRVLTTLSELINKLHSPEVLDSMLEHLANQHAAMPGVKVKKRQQFSVMHLKEFTLANHLHLQSNFSPQWLPQKVVLKWENLAKSPTP